MDAIDRQIITLLAGNGRLSFAEIARQVGLSGPSVLDRVGKLENAGVIRGYRAQLDFAAIGLGVTAFVGLVQDANAEVDDIVAALSVLPEIEACYFLAGVESFLLLVRVPTIAALEQLIVRLNRTPGVASTRTTIALSTKWEGQPPSLVNSTS